jgi:hypothetical protein
VKPEGKHLCPVCGYPELAVAPYYEAGVPSFSLCPSCGVEFGFDDDAGACGEDLAPGLVGEHSASNPAYVEAAHAKLRQRWIESGMKWWSSSIRAPENWDPRAQLKRVSE